MHGGPGSEESIDPNETPEERERREKDRRAANNARERWEKYKSKAVFNAQNCFLFSWC